MGAWIETERSEGKRRRYFVAPHVGAWIETILLRFYTDVTKVAPHVGAWIETVKNEQENNSKGSRSPRGSVD